VAGVGAVICACGTIGPATKLDSIATAFSEEVVPVVKLAERAARAGARRFVFISSGGTVYGPTAQIPTPKTASVAPINTYGMIKAATEYGLLEVARKTSMSVTILRVSNPYGPGQLGTRQLGFVAAAIRAAQKDTPLTIWGDGSVTRDFVFIDDVGRAIALAVESDRGSAVLNIGSGISTSLREVCDMVSKATGKTIETNFQEGRSVDVKASTLCIDRAREVLGWLPEIDVRRGIDLTAEQAE
jgi:UDP-glucose 4-epimerase